MCTCDDSGGGYPLVGSRYKQTRFRSRFKASDATKTPSCSRDDFPSHLSHLLQKMRPRATTMRDPTPTRLTERPTGRSLALLHRIARAHTATPNTSSVYPRKRIPRTKCLKLALRRYTRAHPRTQCLSDGAEAGSRSIGRRGRADPVGAGRGAVNLACPVAWQSRKRLKRSATFHSKPAVFCNRTVLKVQGRQLQ